jgi:hypothetical protein
MYHRDPALPSDDSTWFVMEKRQSAHFVDGPSASGVTAGMPFERRLDSGASPNVFHFMAKIDGPAYRSDSGQYFADSLINQ